MTLIIQKKKRGRPPKIKAIVEDLINIKRKRGRPRKNIAVGEFNPQLICQPKKRGRPRKINPVKSTPAKNIKSAKTTNENCVVGKMFIHNKKVSKQESWFEEWENKLWKSTSQKDWATLLTVISELQEQLNRMLKQFGDPVLSVHIPITKLSQDEEILQIIFDPVNRGVDLKVSYRSKDFPLGLSPSMKATAVCNKMTEMLKSYVPLGVSG